MDLGGYYKRDAITQEMLYFICCEPITGASQKCNGDAYTDASAKLKLSLISLPFLKRAQRLKYLQKHRECFTEPVGLMGVDE